MDVVHLSKEYLGDVTKHLCYDAVEGTVYEVHLGLNNIARVFKIVSVEGLAKVVDVELDNNQLHKLIELCVGIPVKEEIVKEVSVFYKYALVTPTMEVSHFNKLPEFRANPKVAPNIFDTVPNRTDTPPKWITDEDLRVIEKSKSTPKPEGDTIDITNEVIDNINYIFTVEIDKEDTSNDQYRLNELTVKNTHKVEIIEIRSDGDMGTDIYLLHTSQKNFIRVHIEFFKITVFREGYLDIDYPTSKVYLSKSSLEALRNLITKRLTSQNKLN